MWVISNKTPFAAGRAWVLDKNGNKLWLVVVKATFSIKPNGVCQLAGASEPVRQMAQAYGEFGQSSLRYESDILGVKPATDIIIRGAAMAPKASRVTALEVALRLGTLEKRLRVTGDRVWNQSALGVIKMSSPEAFEQMPITYERAYGGWDRSAPENKDHRMDDRNPVGTGFAVREENCEGLRLPNIEYADQLISSWQDRPAPAGFNVIDSAWMPRRKLAGTYDEGWRANRFPLWAADFDSHYLNCAPTDQQSNAYLLGGERIEINNMSAGGSLVFEIPQVRPHFRTRFDKERVDHEGQLCTVIIEPNVPRLVLAWQTSLLCNRQADLLDETLVVERMRIE